jgi:hypothetical protein
VLRSFDALEVLVVRTHSHEACATIAPRAGEAAAAPATGLLPVPVAPTPAPLSASVLVSSSLCAPLHDTYGRAFIASVAQLDICRATPLCRPPRESPVLMLVFACFTPARNRGREHQHIELE